MLIALVGFVLGFVAGRTSTFSLLLPTPFSSTSAVSWWWSGEGLGFYHSPWGSWNNWRGSEGLGFGDGVGGLLFSGGASGGKVEHVKEDVDMVMDSLVAGGFGPSSVPVSSASGLWDAELRDARSSLEQLSRLPGQSGIGER